MFGLCHHSKCSIVFLSILFLYPSLVNADPPVNPSKASTIAIANQAQAIEPKIQIQQKEHIIVLPLAMKNAMMSYDSGFRLLQEKEFEPSLIDENNYSSKNTPFGVIGDFNGDGKKDVALLGYNSKHKLEVIAVLSQKDGYQVQRMKDISSVYSDNRQGKPEYKVDVFLEYQDTAILSSNSENCGSQKPYHPKHEGIRIFYDVTYVEAVFLEGQSFRSFCLRAD